VTVTLTAAVRAGWSVGDGAQGRDIYLGFFFISFHFYLFHFISFCFSIATFLLFGISIPVPHTAALLAIAISPHGGALLILYIVFIIFLIIIYL